MTLGHESARQRIWDEYTYRILAGAAFTLLGIGTVAYRFLEDWSWVDSLYFSTVAVTTVGFGDLAPSSDASKLFTVLYILTGISIIATYLNARLQHRRARLVKRSD
jgi:hypothetical protein